MKFSEEPLATKLANAIAIGIRKGNKHVDETPALRKDRKNMRSRVITSFVKEQLMLTFPGCSSIYESSWDCLIIDTDGFRFSFASEATFAKDAIYKDSFEYGCLFDELKPSIKAPTLQELKGLMCWAVYDESLGNLISLKLKSKKALFTEIDLFNLVDTAYGPEAIIAKADTDFEIIADYHKTEAK